VPRQANALFSAVLCMLGALCLTNTRLAAQENGLKHNLTVGGGVAVAGADARAYMSSSFLLRVNYAYRFHRNLQAELGLDALFGAAGVNKVQSSVVGDIKVHDSEYLVPFGARAILPLLHDRLELSAGGGGMYLLYAEEAAAPEGVTVYCPYGGCALIVDCTTCKSRSGWGYYGVAGAAYSLDNRRRLWLGFSGRFMRGTTSGQPLGTGPHFETKDQWFATAVELTFRL
jgi:hypothetical protein